MDSLTRLPEAAEKLCAFLKASDRAAPAANTVESLFAPVRDTDDISVEVEIAFLVAPAAHRVPLYVQVPHEVMLGNICLVTAPPQQEYKDKLLILSEEGDRISQRVKRVMDTKKLSVKAADPVAVRALAKSYDNFVVYGVHKYPKQLSGEFLGHQRTPVWVTKKGAFAENLHQATKTVVITRRGENAVTCRVGHTGLSTDELVENVKTFLAKFTSHPQGAPLENILHIRVAGTNAGGKRAGLPIFGQSFDISATTSEPAKKRAKTEA